MINIDTNSSISIHEQIVSKMKQLIIAEALKENEKIPSIREMSKLLVINPNTVHKAYQTLEQKGFLTSGQKRGYYVKKLDISVKEIEIEEQNKKLENIIKNLMMLGVEKETLIRLINNIEVKKC